MRENREKYESYDSPMYNLRGMKMALADREKQRVNK
jgi:hypothetical protein